MADDRQRPLKFWCASPELEQAFGVPQAGVFDIDDLIRSARAELLGGDYRVHKPQPSIPASDWVSFRQQTTNTLCNPAIQRTTQVQAPNDNSTIDYVFVPYTPAPLADTLAPLLTIAKYHRTVTKGKASPPPSDASRVNQYRKMQRGDDPILDGRYTAESGAGSMPLGPPIEIFHPCFAQFLHDVDNTELPLPREALLAAKEYAHLASGMYLEEARRSSAIKEVLQKLLKQELIKVENADRTKADFCGFHDISWKEFHKMVITILGEDKNEIGTGNSDPSVQAPLSTLRYWVQEANDQTRVASCCPTFILATAGPHFMVLGCVLTDSFIVQPLTPYFRATDFSRKEGHYHLIARVFCALRNGLDSLRKFWNALEPNEPLTAVHPRFFPHCKAFVDEHNELRRFRYERRLDERSDCVTFLARLEDSDENVVVKFVTRYNREAHEHLAGRNMAPGLLAYQPLYDNSSELHMVVMDYVAGGRTVFDRWQDIQAPVPVIIRTSVKQAIVALHEHNFVFGDLRRQNVMVDENNRAMLVDFDWVGTDEHSEYPLRMSDDETIWASAGMGPLKVMKKAHDFEMLNKYFATSYVK